MVAMTCSAPKFGMPMAVRRLERYSEVSMEMVPKHKL